MAGALPHAFRDRPGRGASRLRPAAPGRRAHRLQARRGALSGVERFMKAYFRVAKEVGDLTAIVCAELEARQAKHRPMLDRLLGRFRRRRGGRLESDDFVVDYNRINVTGESAFERDPVNLIRLFWLADRHNLADPPGCEPARDALAPADRPDAPQRPRGEPPVPGRPDLAQRAGGGAAADERGRGARPLHPRFRPHRRDDAVQHVPPLHGRRASPALDRRARRDRRPAGRARAPALEPHRALDPEPAGPLRRAVPARHRQGPHRGPFDRRRRHRAQARAAARPRSGRNRDRRLARRASSPDVDHRPEPRPLRPEDDRDLRRRGADHGAAEAAARAHDRRHQGGRSRGLDRLEGRAPAHPLLRDRGGADRRPFRARAHGPGAAARRTSSAPRFPTGATTPSRSMPSATTRPIG